MTSLTLVFADAAELRVFFEEHLSKGRAFVAGGAGVSERDACELVLEHGERTHRLAGEVVHVRTEDPGRGVGLQLVRLDTNAAAALRAFVDGSEATDRGDVGGADDERSEETSDEATDEEPATESEGHPGVASLHDRIRNLSGPEQLRLASGGTLAERTALERMYGPTVWETLLRNARLTLPEVARIARKGSLPRPLVELVASNAPWLASGEVQRALLSNPRSSPAVVQKVLGAMSRRDLMLVPQQTAYPETVRAAAKKRLGR
jgi:hypothetical protein